MLKFSAIACVFLFGALVQHSIAADNGAYVGVGAGSSTASIATPATGLSNTYSSTGVTLFGGYQFNKNLAVEGEYFDLGSFTDSPLTMKATGYGASGVGLIPLEGGKISFFGKIGLASVTIAGSLPPGGVFLVPSSETKTAVFWGLGMNYDMTSKATLRLAFNSYEYSAFTGFRTGRIGFLSVGGMYHF